MTSHLKIFTKPPEVPPQCNNSPKLAWHHGGTQIVVLRSTMYVCPSVTDRATGRRWVRQSCLANTPHDVITEHSDVIIVMCAISKFMNVILHSVQYSAVLWPAAGGMTNCMGFDHSLAGYKALSNNASSMAENGQCSNQLALCSGLTVSHFTTVTSIKILQRILESAF